jgi:hypothetical protein
MKTRRRPGPGLEEGVPRRPGPGRCRVFIKYFLFFFCVGKERL